jgi:hypothetical protein
LKDGHDTEGLRTVGIFAHALCDGVAESPQFGRDEGGCLFFVVGKLGIPMQVLVRFTERQELTLRGLVEIDVLRS